MAALEEDLTGNAWHHKILPWDAIFMLGEALHNRRVLSRAEFGSLSHPALDSIASEPICASQILGLFLRQPISLRNPIPNLLFLLRGHRSALLITPLLPHMLVVPRMSFAQIRIP
jgi:hypothetical protein